MPEGYYTARASAGRVALAVLVTAALMAAAYLVAALLVAAIVVVSPALALTAWYAWAVALVQAVPLYIGAWLAGALGTRVAATAPMRPGVVRVATVMAAPVVITVALAVPSAGAAWFATTMAVVVTVAGSALGAVRRTAGPVRE